MSVTGYLYENLPDSPERDNAMGLVRMGIAFKQNHIGRRHGYFFNYLVNLAGKINTTLTFDCLLTELSFEARRRELLGETVSPIEKVDREWELLTYHDPKRGRQQMPFATLRNKLSQVKTRLPLNR